MKVGGEQLSLVDITASANDVVTERKIISLEEQEKIRMQLARERLGQDRVEYLPYFGYAAASSTIEIIPSLTPETA